MERTRRPLEEELDIIRKVVWSYVNSCPGLEFDDLFAEAYLAYLEALPRYDSTKGKISTFIYHVVRNRLNNMFKMEKRKRTNEYLEDISEMKNLLHQERFPNPEQYLLAKEHEEELFAAMSTEAFAICKLIMEESDIFLSIDKPRQCRGIIYRELRKRNWSWAKIWETSHELKQVFSSVS